MLNRTTRGAAVVAASLLTTVAMTQVAQAETLTVTDGAAHISSIRFDHGTTNIKVVANSGPMDFGDFFTFYLDTDAGNAGPEYKSDVYPNSDGVGLMKVGSFGDEGKLTNCPGFRAVADADGPEIVSILVPRSCIGKPAVVRVSVRGEFAVPGPNEVDWVPGKQKFSSWIQQ